MGHARRLLELFVFGSSASRPTPCTSVSLFAEGDKYSNSSDKIIQFSKFMLPNYKDSIIRRARFYGFTTIDSRFLSLTHIHVRFVPCRFTTSPTPPDWCPVNFL